MATPVTEPPAIDCETLPDVAHADLNAVRTAFRQAAPVPLRQAWRADVEPEFAPGEVRTGWRGETLFVFAELADADIASRATDHNQRFWELGDTFEIFLQPAGQSAYVELHVAPGNWRIHARFPGRSGPPAAAPPDSFAAALRPPDAFGSRTWVNVEARAWQVLAEIPAAIVRGRPEPLEGTTCRFSFCRYDYTRGRDTPVISSSSPHPVPAFHRPEEWGVLRFR